MPKEKICYTEKFFTDNNLPFKETSSAESLVVALPEGYDPQRHGPLFYAANWPGNGNGATERTVKSHSPPARKFSTSDARHERAKKLMADDPSLSYASARGRAFNEIPDPTQNYQRPRPAPRQPEKSPQERLAAMEATLAEMAAPGKREHERRALAYARSFHDRGEHCDWDEAMYQTESHKYGRNYRGGEPTEAEIVAYAKRIINRGERSISYAEARQELLTS